jgi:hypothetical protein
MKLFLLKWYDFYITKKFSKVIAKVNEWTKKNKVNQKIDNSMSKYNWD